MKIFTKTLFVVFLSDPPPGTAQSPIFGKNKVVYDQLDFRIYETPIFLIYHYLEDGQEIELFASRNRGKRFLTV